MVEDVEELGAELHVDVLGDRCVVVDGEIPLPELGRAEGVAAEGPEVAGSGGAVGEGVGGDLAGKRVRDKLNVIAGLALVVDRRADDVGAVVAFGAATEVVFKVVVELEGLAALERDGVINIVTRSGANAIYADIFDIFRNNDGTGRRGGDCFFWTLARGRN